VISTVRAARGAAALSATGTGRGGVTEAGDIGRHMHGRNISELGHNDIIIGTLLFHRRQNSLHTTELKSPNNLVTARKHILGEVNIIP
jgi:hypothetical protein